MAMKNLLPILLFAALAFFVNDAATALPKFSSRTGWKCQACHVNPSGGGMRLVGGVKYGREELPVTTWADEFALDEFSTQLNNFVSVGADFRTLFFYLEDATDDKNAFFQMQGDVYMNFRLAKKVNIYLDKGLYSGFEIFGQANVLPENGSVKVGKFVPNYGTRLDDHRTYIREFTGLSLETGTPYYTGAELAVSPGPATITAGIFNSSEGRGTGIDKNKAFLGRAEGLFELAEGTYLGLGANILYKDVQGGKTSYLGGFGSFSYENFTILGEADLVKNDVSGSRTDGLILYGEMDYMVVQGLDLKFIYDFYDLDIDLQTGAFSRYSFGFEFFPISGVEVRPLYRINMEEPEADKVDNNEIHMLVHFYL
jgi:hypothetical protein